jgi:hypothetical protein
MRQKFQIDLNGAGTCLNIREFAIVDHHLNRVQFSLLEHDKFRLLNEAVFDKATIANSILTGIGQLVATLRSTSFFPNRHMATQIAEAIVTLCASPGDGSVELFFDDHDRMTTGLPGSGGLRTAPDFALS